ncbi:pheromone A receptor-domain-containing protein [Schizophyllum amplum]|uniref:Pheromone A receptor-domain-containing protein n=1 Tax=Schizophyllum amplum TaxID=97359 RepID=A0A550C0K7_9AGAR|nr:pheromone A receptor-domain-containing protein [Auriculariopsis ampla]
MLDPTYPAFPVCAFLGFMCCMVPLPWHLQSWNSGTCFLMIWTAIACLSQFVNSIIWADHSRNVAPICYTHHPWRLRRYPASSLCIVRRLYSIAKVQAVSSTRAEKFRAIMVDSLICVLFPILYIVLQIVVQGHRFNILENIGCFPAIVNTPLTYPITFMWPVLVGFVSAIYSVLTLVHFNRHRLQFSQFLHSNSTLSVSRYLRLMALALTEIMCTTPMGIFVIILNAKATPVSPYVSWEATHWGYSRVDQVPAILWRSDRLLVASYELTRWSSPAIGFIFFFYFGFAQEARRNYAAAWSAVRRFLRIPETLPSLPGSKKPFAMPSMGNSLPAKAKAYPAPPKQYASNKPYATPIPIHMHGMQKLASFDLCNKDLPPYPDVEAYPSAPIYTVEHSTVVDSFAIGTAYSTDGTAYTTDSTTYSPDATPAAFRSHSVAYRPHSVAVSLPMTATAPAADDLPDTPSSCSSSDSFSTLQSRDFIVLPSTRPSSAELALPRRPSPSSPPRLPRLSQLFGIAPLSETVQLDAPEAEAARPTSEATRQTSEAEVEAAEPRSPGLLDVPTSPRTHFRHASV